MIVLTILNKKDLEYYLKQDQRSLVKSGQKHPRLIGDDIWKFQIVLRKHEYYTNVRQTLISKIMKKFYSFLHYKKGLKLGFSIPVNVFGPGLKINHFGLIVVNPGARIGANCDIHQGVNIGQNLHKDDVPIIGDNTWIGPGVKIFGKIIIADNIAIGAGAIVNKSFTENSITIAGVPAKKVKDEGTEKMIVAATINSDN